MPDLRAVEEIERKQLRKAFLSATLGSLLHKATEKGCLAAISWAAVVLLGGFASDISVSDLLLVTNLATFMFVLRGVAPFSTKLLTRKTLHRGSINPVNLCYRDRYLFYAAAIQIVVALVQWIFIAPSLLSAFSRLKRDDLQNIHWTVGWHPPISIKQHSVLNPEQSFNECVNGSFTNFTRVSSCFESVSTGFNLQLCLYLFLKTVEATCIIATVFSLFVLYLGFRSLRTQEVGLRKYHNEVMRRGINEGILRADEFDVIDFFFGSLGEDLTLRNIGALEVKKQNLQVLDYLYSHPTGVQRVLGGLTSSNSVQQQTMANIVGFWAGRSLENERALLSELATKLGLPGRTAEAAANSFYALANKWKDEKNSPLLEIMTAKGEAACNVVQKVIDLILKSRLPTLQVYMRLLDGFFMSKSVLRWLRTSENRHENIKKKLWQIAQQQSWRGRINTREPNVGQNIEIDTGTQSNGTEENAQSNMRGSAFNTEMLRDIRPRRRTAEAETRDMGGRTETESSNTDQSGSRLQNVFLALCARLLSKFRNEENKEEGRQAAPSIRARTAFLAFSAWVRLSEGSDQEQAMTLDVENQAQACMNSLNANFGEQAQGMMSDLDKNLEDQRFLWWDEAERFRKLWDQFVGCQRDPGEWLLNCQKRGREYASLP